MRIRHRARAPIAALAAMAATATLASGTAIAAPAQPLTPTPPAKRQNTPAGPTTVAPPQRTGLLGQNWKQSQDRAWTTSSDAEGFHLLVADKKTGYSWRTAASLSEPGFDTDMWIGNACVTGSGRRAVVAYAPRTFTNKPDLMARGAFAAVIDLNTGKVTKFERQVSLAYFSPGCGLGESAVFTRFGGETKNATQLIKVNAATAKLGKPVQLKGEVTSAVPVGEAIIAADGTRLVKITDTGKRTPIAHTSRIPFLLKPDAEGGVVYMDRAVASPRSGAPRQEPQAQAEVLQVPDAAITHPDAKKTRPARLASGPLAGIDLTGSANGKVFVTGAAKAAAGLSKAVVVRSDVPRDAVASTRGEALITRTAWSDGRDPRGMARLSANQRVAKIGLHSLSTGKATEFQVLPGQNGLARTIQGHRRSPALPAPAKPLGEKGSKSRLRSGTVDDDRTCSVARNDPAKQATQPKPRQVEWAVNMAVSGNLNYHISRPANWKNLGMPAYRPQDADMFPLQSLAGGGRVPMQVMLGVTAQESNMWQAARFAVPGVTGNPLIGNYYGTKYTPDGQQQDPWGIDWADADCGYGITQVTDGMRLPGKEKPGEVAKSSKQQQAIALDYTVNIAAGVNILIDKWNQTYNAGLRIDNADPQWMETWYFALWAYNSGFYPASDAPKNAGTWGLGFTNNPANPLWKANRPPFLSNADGSKDDYSHAAHPQDWPYQEKVLGWAGHPLQGLESPGNMVVGFRPAWWNTTGSRATVQPPENLFCNSGNECDPSKIGPDDSNQPGMGACTRADLHCWWHFPTSWKSCASNVCGHEIWRFDPPADYPEQADGTAYPPNCTLNGLPAGALIVDDVPDSTPIHRPGCAPPTASSGSFSFDYGSESAKIDLHQLGAGYGSHFWFAHGRDASSDYDRLRVTGTWQLNTQLSKPVGRVFVHIPDHGAQVPAATYEVLTARGTRTVTIPQATNGTNHWVELGSFGFQGVKPAVRLTNKLAGGNGEKDVAYDAVAFAPTDFVGSAPVIHLPDPDPNAPEPEAQTENEDPAQAAPSGLDQPPTLNVARPTRNCETSKSDPKKQYCFTIKPAAPTKLKGKSLLPHTRLINDSCGVNQTIFNRFASCEHLNEMTYSVTEGGTTQTLGVFVGQWEVLLKKNTPTFQMKFSMVPVMIAPKAESVTFHFNYGCSGECKTTSVTGNGMPFTWLFSEKHTASTTYTFEWSKKGSTSARHDVMTIGASDTHFTSLGGGGGNSSIHTWSTKALGIRCDNEVGGNEGCAFSKFTPTYTINVKKFPAAAAMYWELMNRLSSHPGSAKHGTTPLHRIEDTATQQRNRGFVCDGTYIPHPDADRGPLGPRESSSCDEYPFAATRESAGFRQISGIACVQFYATKVTGSWELWLDPGYGTPVTWNEPCGRGAIPLNQNTGAGGGVGGLPAKVRLLDGDAYWIETPYFDDQCNPTAPACTIRTS
ncbi:hypothetical protein GWI34_05540 [Actinomadura sp. DSM 109109]|nr:hypothetical protein [Actinomadura lepetitiana]